MIKEEAPKKLRPTRLRYRSAPKSLWKNEEMYLGLSVAIVMGKPFKGQ